MPLNGEMPDLELGPKFDNGMEFVYPYGVAADENYQFVSDKSTEQDICMGRGNSEHNEIP